MRKKKVVDCKKIEKMIPLYLENKLPAADINALLMHIESCKNCREELTIQYMVSEGLSKAENENDYNLLKNLEERLNDSVKQVKNHDFLVFGFLFVLFSVACIIVMAIMKMMI